MRFPRRPDPPELSLLKHANTIVLCCIVLSLIVIGVNAFAFQLVMIFGGPVR